ncbi:inositol polyphosphate kinase kcs1 [Coemansia javaensis]|uniref:Kinase n=1 Tax=Coemansia javaensis TaxID=2761396 RepID=A0A9W8LL54_9FUNG|nr:inositol polyphosphate kinase kcs1 [Coemansia javaensis]
MHSFRVQLAPADHAGAPKAAAGQSQRRRPADGAGPAAAANAAGPSAAAGLLAPGRALWRQRSASPQCFRSEPPGIWLDVNDDDEGEEEEEDTDLDDDCDLDGADCCDLGDDDGSLDGGDYSGSGSSQASDDGLPAGAGRPNRRRRRRRRRRQQQQEEPWPGPRPGQRAGSTTPPSLALTPFVNQVGGHTPFLKFSGSAICKPMNERERRFYEAVDYLHADLYKFVPSCLGVVNVTYRRPADGGEPVPEVFLEQNLHILPSCLARQLAPSQCTAAAAAAAAAAAPGSLGARKMHLSGAWREMQEQILTEAFSPRALKARARQQARIRSQGPVRRRHSLTDLHPTGYGGSKPAAAKADADRVRAAEARDEAHSLGDGDGDRDAAAMGPIYNAAVSRSSTADTDSVSSASLASSRATSASSGPALAAAPAAGAGDQHQRQDQDQLPQQPCGTPDFVSLWKKRCGKRMPTDADAVDGSTHQFILMADLTAAMRRPCILDLKMGTRQHGVDAPAKKVVSQTIKCAATTSKELGVRMCGLQVYKADRNRYLFQDKYYGRSLNKFTFQRSLIEFLDNGERVVACMIPPLLARLRSLYRTVEQMHGFRFFGSSLLLVYDGHAATRAAEEEDQEALLAGAALRVGDLRIARRQSALGVRVAGPGSGPGSGSGASASAAQPEPTGAPLPPESPGRARTSYHAGATPANSYADRLELSPAGVPTAATPLRTPAVGLAPAPKSAAHIDIRIIDFANCSFVMDPDLYAEPTLARPEASGHDPCCLLDPASPGCGAAPFRVTEADPVPPCPRDERCAGPDYGYLRGIRTLVREFADIWRRHASDEARLLHDQAVLRAAEGVGVRLAFLDSRYAV